MSEPGSPFAEQHVLAGSPDPAAPTPFAERRFCLRCQEDLFSLTTRCVRCQLQFDPQNPETYRVRRSFLWWKFWLPGFCLAVGSGVLSYGLGLAISGGELGAGLFLGVSVSAGAIFGFATRIPIWAAILLSIPLVAALVISLMAMNLAGAFCGVTVGIIFMIPAGLGCVAGTYLRFVLKASRWDQAYFLPLIALAAIPYAWMAAERMFPRRMETAVVTTQRVFEATPQGAWDSIRFYEEVGHEPPWLLKLSLPKPLGSEGPKQAVGDVVTCRYDRGKIVKRITEYEPGRRLTFEVIEQQIHFERDVELQRGSFEIEPLADGRTKVVLTTEYRRKLYPRWTWEPIEREVIHTLHEHVLEGMARQAEQSNAPPNDPRYHDDPSFNPEPTATADAPLLEAGG